jgi:NTP pyrophosphatase (non-canonical NTP hydrolase)
MADQLDPKNLQDVLNEYERAISIHKKFNSRHEGFAVLLEEVDELWDEVKKNQKKHPELSQTIRKEAIQVAAMALRFVQDCTIKPDENGSIPIGDHHA